ncbi:MAG: DUF3883 domain-containing protein [Rhodobacteraceae bacterium]|nr:DUF3883 domain-containing protein [Paracoccaceae bacterium]
MSGREWSDAENDAVVADYLSMLHAELKGSAFNKAAQNRALQEEIGRSKGSIEYKHQNISAILMGLGETWIDGYKPAHNYQQALVDTVLRQLERWEHADDRLSLLTAKPNLQGRIPIGPPPTLRNTEPPAEWSRIQALAHKNNAAERDEKNRALGEAGEKCVFHHERASLASSGRKDLAGRVRWVSKEDGDGAGYDIASYTTEGRSRLIEVKTTNGWERTPFHLSRNERNVAEDNPDSWILFRLWNFVREPRAFELRPPLDAHLELTAMSFRASLR